MVIGMTDAEKDAYDLEHAEQYALSKELHNAYYEAILSGKVVVDALGHDVTSNPEEIRKQVESGWGFWARIFDKDIETEKYSYPFNGYHSIRLQQEMLDALKNPQPDLDLRDWFRIQEDSDCYACGEGLRWKTNGAVIKPEVFIEDKTIVLPEGATWRDRVMLKRKFEFAPCKYAGNKPKEYLSLLHANMLEINLKNIETKFWCQAVKWL